MSSNLKVWTKHQCAQSSCVLSTKPSSHLTKVFFHLEKKLKNNQQKFCKASKFVSTTKKKHSSPTIPALKNFLFVTTSSTLSCTFKATYFSLNFKISLHTNSSRKSQIFYSSQIEFQLQNNKIEKLQMREDVKPVFLSIMINSTPSTTWSVSQTQHTRKGVYKKTPPRYMLFLHNACFSKSIKARKVSKRKNQKK